MSRGNKLRLIGGLLRVAPKLPWRVVLFQARALLVALRRDDTFTLQSVARPEQVATLLRLAGDRPLVVELGTATGWTAAAFVLADARRQVISCDPVVQRERGRYLGLLPAAASARLTLLQMEGAAAATTSADPVGLLFVDSSHDEQATLDEWRAWRPRLAPGAVVVLHDYGHPAFPGVAAAVERLGLDGEVADGMFVCTLP